MKSYFYCAKVFELEITLKTVSYTELYKCHKNHPKSEKILGYFPKFPKRFKTGNKSKYLFFVPINNVLAVIDESYFASFMKILKKLSLVFLRIK